MSITLNPDNYRHVPVLYWPWVFVQLLRLEAWIHHHQREVIYRVFATGRVAIWYVGDDSADLQAWLARRARIPAPHLAYCDNAAGDVDVNYFVLAVARAIEATGFMERWIWVRIVPRRIPPIQDSS